MDIKLNKLFHFIVFFLLFTVSYSVNINDVQAQNAESCDSDVLAGMNGRAWMEAQREISENKDLIFKPDSVLEYTCFNRLVGAFNAGGELPAALTSMIGTPLTSYLNSNFGENPNPLDARVGAIGDFNARGGIQNDYSCNVMNAVWHEAKCYDFAPRIDPPEGFGDFSQYTDANSLADPRIRCVVDGARFGSNDSATRSWREEGDWATNAAEIYIDSLQALDTVDCMEPVGTGVMVQLKRASGSSSAPLPYEEGVCIVPGCYYTPPSGGGDASSGSCE